MFRLSEPEKQPVKGEDMQRIPALIGAALLMTAYGYSETIITAQDYAVDSDVVLESALQEVKSIPRDTVNVIGDGVKYIKDETVTAANGVAAIFKKDLHAQAQMVGELAVEDAWDTSNNTQFRSYKVADSIGRLLLTKAEDQDTPFIEVSDFFSGVEFPEKTSAYYMPKFKRLLVRQTMENILSIEDVLADYQSARRDLFGRQVEIETKFVEVSQNTLNELGFDWHFRSKDGGDLRLLNDLYLPAGQDILSQGLRTAATAIGATQAPGVLGIGSAATESLQWNLFISALEQSDDTDVLSAPRVVVLDGGTATIQVGEEEMLPQSFEANNQETSPYIEHGEWELELMGVTLEVTPEIREEGLIDLELHPKVTELLGQDTYQVTEVIYESGLNNGIGRPALFASLPYVRIREIETRVTVADGSTVAMGGLLYDKLETFRDKVPVLGSIPLLGRLFRSEGEKSIKRNLMIFVTATQVDINGRRYADVALRK